MMNDRPIMTPYPEYKTTNLPWLPQIPAHWDIVPFAACAKEKSITNQSDLELLSVYLDRGVIRFSQEAAKRTNVTSEDLSKYQRVDVGDLVLNNQQAWRGSVGVSSFTGIVSPAYIVLKLSDRLYSKFANYLFRDNLMVAHYVTASKGIGSIQRNLYWVNLKRKNLFLPPIDEQEQIVRYLDSMTAKINKLIRAKKKQIALLQEQKQAIINQAVTKGLNPNAEMKDSGIDWLGQIPAHWGVMPMSKISNIVRGASPRPAGDPRYFQGNDIPWITVAEVTKDEDKYLYNTSSFLTYAGQLQSRTIAPNTLLLSNSGATLGVPKITKISGCINDGSVAFLAPKANIEYLYYSLKSQTTRLRNLVAGYGQPNLNTTIVKNIFIALPPSDEQEKIFAYLDLCFVKINNLIDRIQKEIETTLEYKNSLIASVVTGQVDVRNIQVEDFDPADLISETDDDPAEEESSEESEVE